MFNRGGFAYVYLCYGIHHLFNVVTGPEDVPHAVLIRAIQPIEGVELMMKRRKMLKILPKLTAGPGTLSQALGITTAMTGTDMLSPNSPVWIEDRQYQIRPEQIMSGPRIGIDYAEDWIDRPLRFWIKDSIWVSRQR
jgi:DNA-3-methyladenine glycosylase